jgi:hypothetical protein
MKLMENGIGSPESLLWSMISSALLSLIASMLGLCSKIPKGEGLLKDGDHAKKWSQLF